MVSNQKTKRTRRPHGLGSVYKTSSGQWKAVLSILQADGERKRVTRNVKSRQHGEMVLREMQKKHHDPARNPGTLEVADICRHWLAQFSGEQSSRDTYHRMVEQQIVPRIGSARASSVQPLQVQQFCQDMRDSGVGARTAQVAYGVLSRAYKWAISMRMVVENPCSGIRRPQSKREPIVPFTQSEVQVILAETCQHRLSALFLLAVTTGMRQGELFGLQWEDVDFENRTVTIRRQARDYHGTVTVKSPKTDAGYRTISITEACCEALRARQRLSVAEKNESSVFVFCSPKGLVMRRTLFGRRVWKPLLAKLGIRHRGAHHLRHTAATMMLTAGVPPHIVAGVLGHENPETVMSIYAHFITNDSRVASAAMSHWTIPEQPSE